MQKISFGKDSEARDVVKREFEIFKVDASELNCCKGGNLRGSEGLFMIEEIHIKRDWISS